MLKAMKIFDAENKEYGSKREDNKREYKIEK